jgi:hypothetical protein
VSIHGNHSHDLLTDGLGEVTLHHGNQVRKKLDLVFVSLFHTSRVSLKKLEGSLNINSPGKNVDQKHGLSNTILDPVELALG